MHHHFILCIALVLLAPSSCPATAAKPGTATSTVLHGTSLQYRRSTGARQLQQRGTGRQTSPGVSFQNTSLARRALDDYPLPFIDTSCPRNLSWVERGLVTEVQDQGDCGSAWAHAVVGAIESAHAIASGQLLKLSVDHLLACDVLNDGCGGGSNAEAFNFLITYPGVVTEDRYAPYGSNATCPPPGSMGSMDVAVLDYQCTPLKEDELLTAVCNQPVTVYIEANEEFANYSGGIFDPGPESACGSSTDSLNHALLLVGYGTTGDGIDYWLARSSWRGSYDSALDWGEGGYVRIRRGINACGLITGPPLFPVVATSRSVVEEFAKADCNITWVSPLPDDSPIDFFNRYSLQPGMWFDELNHDIIAPHLARVTDGSWTGGVYSINPVEEYMLPICPGSNFTRYIPFTGPSPTNCTRIELENVATPPDEAQRFKCEAPVCSIPLQPGDTLVSILDRLGVMGELDRQLLLRQMAILNSNKPYLLMLLMAGQPLLAAHIFELGDSLSVDCGTATDDTQGGGSGGLAKPPVPPLHQSPPKPPPAVLPGADLECQNFTYRQVICPLGWALAGFESPTCCMPPEEDRYQYRCCTAPTNVTDVNMLLLQNRSGIAASTPSMGRYIGAEYSYIHQVRCPTGSLVSELNLAENNTRDSWRYNYKCTASKPGANLTCREVYKEVDVRGMSTALYLATALTPGFSCAAKEMLNGFRITRGHNTPAFYVATCCRLALVSARPPQPTPTAFIVDSALSCIYRLPLTGGTNMTVLAGTCSSDTGPANVGAAAAFYQPNDLAVHQRMSVLYVADTQNNCIRTVNITSGRVTTLAGMCGSVTGSGDGLASAARFNTPNSVGCDEEGNVYVSDTGNNCIRKILPNGTVSTLAGVCGSNTAGHADGMGTAAVFAMPHRIYVDSVGRAAYVTQPFYNCVRKVTFDGLVTSVFGSCAHPSKTDASMELTSPVGVAVDPQGLMYVSDAYNNCIRKRKLDGSVAVLAGMCDDTFGMGTFDGTGDAAWMSWPQSLFLTATGDLFFPDSGACLRKINPAGEVTSLAGACRGFSFYDARFESSTFSGVVVYDEPPVIPVPPTLPSRPPAVQPPPPTPPPDSGDPKPCDCLPTWRWRSANYTGCISVGSKAISWLDDSNIKSGKPWCVVSNQCRNPDGRTVQSDPSVDGVIVVKWKYCREGVE